MGVWYATREDVQRALDSKETARNGAQIDRALESASRSVEALCHRTFAPTLANQSTTTINTGRGSQWYGVS